MMMGNERQRPVCRRRAARAGSLRVAGVLLSAMLLTPVLLSGCGGGTPAPSELAGGPLTVAEWKQLPTEIKYEEATLTRLKQHDPRLSSGREWNLFVEQVVQPELKKDTQSGRKG